MDIDDELLTGVLTKVRERNASTHLSLTPQPNGPRRVGFYQYEQAYPGAGPTKRHSDHHLRSFEMLDMEAKRRHRHLLRNGGTIEDNARGRTEEFTEQRDSESIVGRTAAYPEQRDSGLIVSSHSPHSSRRTRNDQVSATPSGRSIPNANIKTSRAEMRSSSREDYSIAWARPEVSLSGGSRSDASSLPRPASRAPSASTADNKGVSKPSDFQSTSTLKPKTRNEGQLRSAYATKQGGSNATSSLYSSSTARNAQLSKPDVNQSTLHPKANKKGHEPAGRANVPLHSKGTTSHKQVSKPAANHTKLKPKIMNAGHLCVGCVAKQGGPSAVGIDVYLDSQNTTRNRVFGVRKIFQRKQKDSQQHHTCAGCATKQDGPCETGSNSSLHSPSTGSSKRSRKSRDTPSTSQAIQKEGITLNAPAESPPVRSSHAHLAQRGSKTTVSTASLLAKDSERSKHSYKSRGMYVTRKNPEKHSSVAELREAFSKQSIASQAPTKNGSKGRDANRSGVSGHREAATTTLSPRDLAVSLYENGTSRLLETTTDSLSKLSSPSGSTAPTRYSILASDRVNPVYHGERYDSLDRDGDDLTGGDLCGGDLIGGESNGCDSSVDSYPTPSEVGKVVAAVRSTAREILSTDGEDVRMGKVAVKGSTEWKMASVDAFIERVCDKLDEFDESLPTCDGSKKAPQKRWWPKLHLSVKW